MFKPLQLLASLLVVASGIGTLMTVSIPSRAEAELPVGGEVIPSLMLPRLTVGAESGVGGRVGYAGRGTIRETSEALLPTFGLTVRMEKPLVEHFSLGARLGVAWWTSRALIRGEVQRSTLTDLGPTLKIRFPFASTGGSGEVYVMAMGGITMQLLDPDIGANRPFGLGWHAGGSTGAQYFFSRHYGIYGEVGWMYHQSYHVDSRQIERVDIHQGRISLGIAILFGTVRLPGDFHQR